MTLINKVWSCEGWTQSPQARQVSMSQGAAGGGVCVGRGAGANQRQAELGVQPQTQNQEWLRLQLGGC